jgi:hypothetical protein
MEEQNEGTSSSLKSSCNTSRWHPPTYGLFFSSNLLTFLFAFQLISFQLISFRERERERERERNR